MSVSDLPSGHALGEAFHSASERLGVPRNPDFNGPNQFGTGYVQTTTRKGPPMDHGVRISSGTGEAEHHVALNALVARIVLEGSRAIGVVWQDPSGAREARARRRGDPVRRHVQFAAAAAALRDRTRLPS